MLHYLINTSYKLLNSKRHNSFRDNSNQLEHIQRHKLNSLLTSLQHQSISYEEFASTYPITTYEDWKDKIEKQRNTGEHSICPDVIRYQPTSGSSGKQKWIPYTKLLLDEFDHAASAWVYDMFLQYPNTMKGSHYWSLSWLPTEDRDKMEVIDDQELFSFWKKFALNKIFSVPKSVALLSSSHQTILATATYIVSDKNLSLISVWSPSFFTSIIEIIFKHKQDIVKTLSTGRWHPREMKQSILKAPKNKKAATLLNNLTKENQTEIWQKLWPKLSLISCWDTALAQTPFKQLKKIFPNTAFQGKGLWSTEAVVTIPYRNNFTLAYQSHFYEFKEVGTERVLPSWELKPNMRVMPILSTGSGLLRYIIEDVLIVDKLWDQIPCLTFQGRTGHMDLVGEKLDHTSIMSLIEKYNYLSNEYEIISLLACNYPDIEKPFYCLLVESDKKQNQLHKFEEELLQFFHYRLAKDVGQLGSFKVYKHPKAKNLYLDLKESEGMIRGNIKPEAITLISNIKGKELLNLTF